MKKLYKKIVSLVMSALLAVMVLPVTTHASNQQDNVVLCQDLVQVKMRFSSS